MITPPRVIPPHYFVLALVAQGAIAALAPQVSVLGSPWRWLGGAFVVAGLLVAMLGSRQFASAGTEIRPLHPSTALVVDGVFRWSRNPMYTSMIVALMGVALLLDQAAPWLVVPPFAALLYFRFVRHEEVLMGRAFGPAYLSYKSRVRRWL